MTRDAGMQTGGGLQGAGLDTGRMRLLLVEDNASFRKLVRVFVDSIGISEVREAADGLKAIAILREFQADVVLMDWKLAGGMDGVDLATYLRTSPDSPNPYVPIIMVTGYSEVGVVKRARDAGVNEFLAKPISGKTLLGRLSAVMQAPRPFVKSAGYFGPDRRRRQVPLRGPERRMR